MEKHFVQPVHAKQVWGWLQTRGGIALWNSVNLSNPGQTWTCPLHDEGGEVKGRPTWQAADEPYRIITDPDEVEVHVPKEVKRFHVGIVPRQGGMRWELTDGATRRVREAVAKANEEHCGGEDLAWYEFDYEHQDAIILVPDRRVPIKEFIDEQRQSERLRSAAVEGSGGADDPGGDQG